MQGQPVGVILELVQGETNRLAVGHLVYEEDQPFAVAVDAGNGTPSFQPPKIKLRPDGLILVREASAGRPAFYRYDDLVVLLE